MTDRWTFSTGARTSLLALLLSLAVSACPVVDPPPGDDDDSGDDDDAANDDDATDDDDSSDDDDDSSDDDDTGPDLYTAAQIERAGVALPFMGNLIPWELLVALISDENSCPAKEEITLGSVAQLTGSGCTDNAGGVRSGVWDIVVNGDTSSTDTFTGWSRSSPGETISYWELNGTMLRSATGTVAVNLDLTLKLSAWSATQDYSLTGVVYDNTDGMNNAALNQAGGDYSASGTLEVAGVDTFEGTLGVSNLGGCDDELDVMTLELDGPAETLHFSQSSKSCDGCTDWWSDEQSGSYCP